MSVREIRDPELATEYVLHSLWLSRIKSPSTTNIQQTLDWAMHIVSEGNALPPVGFIADVGNLASGVFQDHTHRGLEIPGLEHTLIRQYEDYVLGKMIADLSFERGSDALMRFQGRDRARGMAFLINQFVNRSGYEGIHISPGIIKTLLQLTVEELVEKSWSELSESEVSLEVLEDYENLTQQVRDLGNVLGTEDIFELEHGTAIAEFGQRLALRQVLKTADFFIDATPHQKIKPKKRRQQVATRIRDEDMYPVGGFTSISNRGTIESLLHSQLAFMESDDAERPDLFDIKFLRDELLYYSRDENQFFRRRKSLVFAIYPQMSTARVKDGDLPVQRIVIVLGLLYAAVQILTQWLSDDALLFDFCFIESEETESLSDEQTLLETLLREEIANGHALVRKMHFAELTRHCDLLAKNSECHLLAIAPVDRQLDCMIADFARLIVDGPRPTLHLYNESVVPQEKTGMPLWNELYLELLASWV